MTETGTDGRQTGTTASVPEPSGRRGVLARVQVVWLLDICSISISLLLGYWLRVGSGLFGGEQSIDVPHLTAMVGIAVLWTAIFNLQGLYRRAKLAAGAGQVLAIGWSVTLGFLLILGLSFAVKRYYFVETRLVLAFGWIFSVATLSLVRVGLVRAALRRGMRPPGGNKRVAVIGAIPFARRLLGKSMPSTNGYDVVGFVETRDGEISADLGPEFVIGRVSSLDDVIGDYCIDELFLPLALLENRASVDVISRCTRTGLPIRLVSDMFQVLMPDEPKERVDGVPKVGLGEPALKGMGVVAKRMVDLVSSVTAVVVFAPLFLLIALLVKLLSPGPVLFKQIRAGKDGRPFTFYKFRTMRHDIDDTIHREYATSFIGGKELRLRDEKADKKIYKMPDDPRVTSVGKILRRTSLDEMPQVFNVLKGDMSVVGPRPPIAYELTVYKEWHKRRLRTKPGITGLWQVSGRSSVPFHDMVLLDLYYINRWSLLLDFEIIVKTIPVILSGKGAY